MYKKVAAGVLALAITLGTAALPNEIYFGVKTSTGAVTASAAVTTKVYEYKDLDDGTIEITKYNGSDMDVVLPDTIDGKKVTSIGTRALSYKAYKSLVIPEGVTTIGKFACMNCTALEKVTIPNTVKTIERDAFSSCKKLNNVVIPDSVTKIDELAFNSCESLNKITLSKNLTYIGMNTFGRCTSLTNIDIPSTVTYIGAYAFSYDKALTKLDIPENVTYIGKNAFLGNGWYDSLPDGMIYFGKVAYMYKGDVSGAVEIKPGTVFVGEDALKGKSITSVKLPESVTSIGSSAFESTAITSIKFPSKLETIGKSAFNDCKELEEINLPASLKSLDEKSFQSCSKVESVVIPNGITEIPFNCFAYCTSLKKVVLPKSVSKIGLYAFTYCSSLSDINITSDIKEILGGAFRRTAITSMVIPDGIKSINQYTFDGCSELTSVKIPDSVTEIDHDSFSNCTKLSDLVIPEGVTKIWGKAFYNCKSLKTLKIPAAVTTLSTKSVGYWYNEETRKDYIPDEFKMICSADSTAEEYAKKYGVKYEIAGEPTVKNLSDCTAELSAAKFTFTGGEIKPSVTVKDGDTVLKEGTDYTVAYKNNAKVGTGSVVITGNGNYEGTVTKTFTILPKSLKYCKVALKSSTLTYNGLAQKPAVQVKIGDKAVYSGNYTVTYKNNVNAGTATVTLTGKGSLQGTVTKTFKITPKSMKYCTVQLKATSYNYTGSAIKPAVRVKIGSTVISSDNYTVAYKNNTNKGTAAVKITGKGNLQGYVVKSFTIK